MQESAHEEIKKHLETIRENSKKMKSQMSKPLTALEEFAKSNISKIQNSDAEFLLLGEGKLQGLIKLSSTKKKFADGFKKSAYTALKILYNLIDFDANQTIANAFFSLEEDKYAELKLDQHIASEDENKLTALLIARKIKVK